MPKKSGAEYRKLRQKREEERKQLAGTWQKWLISQNTDIGGSSLSNVCCEEVEKSDERHGITEAENIEPEKENSSLILMTSEDEELNTHFDNKVEDETNLFDPVDPATWVRPYSNSFISALVENGPKQDEGSDYSKSADNEGRQFSSKWFFKIMPNGESVRRDWLIFSKRKQSLFCFACLLFGKFKHRAPKLADPDCGFSKWKKLNPKISDHENSQDHRNAYISWKGLERRLKTQSGIDMELEKNIQTEKNKWRHILKAVINAILFCADNNLPLRGSSNDINSTDCGIFLKIINLIAKHDPEICNHVESLKAPGKTISYFSNTIQNEIINHLAGEVRKIIFSEIQTAKYYSISFDCTPDTSHKEQMTQIVRYVKIQRGICSIQERFIDFIETKEKTGEGLAQEILHKMQRDNLDIKNCRAQCYDNGANMAGKYKGVQSRILNVNEFAYFLPCSSHSLNLVGVHAASISPKMMAFFGTVQNLFVFFSSSTHRWDTLKSHLSISLKKHCDTRWSSKKQTVSAVHNQLPNILQALEDLVQTRKNEETYSGAKNFLCQIKDFHFICSLVMWNRILGEMDEVNILLQKKTITVTTACRLIECLRNTIVEIRNEKSEKFYEKSANLAKLVNVEPAFKEKRRRKVCKQFDYESRDTDLNESEKFRLIYIEGIDTIIEQLTWRFEKLRQVSQDFDFLSGSNILSHDEDTIKKDTLNLTNKYRTDLNGQDFLCEILSAKKLFQSLNENFENMEHLEILQLIHQFELTANYKNMETAYRIFLSIPVTSASAERSFSKLKLVKNYLRATMAQDRLANLSLLSIESDVARLLDIEKIIDDFAALKARKVKLS